MRRAQRMQHLLLWIGVTLVVMALLTIAWLNAGTITTGATP